MIEPEPIVFVVDDDLTTHRSAAPSSASLNPLDSGFKPSDLRRSSWSAHDPKVRRASCLTCVYRD
jgi:hypothetical protein